MMSLLLCYLTVLLIGFLTSIMVTFKKKLFTYLTLIVIIFFFMTTSMFWLFVFFELSLIPILILIVGWGYQYERLQSSTYLLIYTVMCSLPMMFFMLLLFISTKTLYLFYSIQESTIFFKTVILLVFFVKLPIFGLHLWLPKAHVEAPTIGSIILAGVLLKLGSYGVIRFLSLFKYINLWFYMILLPMATILSCLFCLFQSDAKSLIAYSSVSHMNFLLLTAMFYFMKVKYLLILMMFSHGIISSSMFFMIGWIYQMNFSRKLYFMQMSFKMNIMFLTILMLTMVSNFGVPPFISSIIELGFMASCFVMSKMLFLFILSVTMISAYSSLYLLLNIMFGKNISVSSSMFSSSMMLNFSFFIYFYLMLVLFNF